MRHVSHPSGTQGSFAALHQSGNVTTWGDTCTGGGSQHVQDLLWHVVDLVATRSAFAALRADGCVIAWGAGLSGKLWSDCLWVRPTDDRCARAALNQIQMHVGLGVPCSCNAARAA
ncbi:smyd2a [Symbiodinium sp. CCMP2456]|nr:smyd2a [Symbiodinium sp. CCMP2456]